MTVEDLLRDPPAFHRDGFGAPVSYAISATVARFLDGNVGAGDATLETGGGLSTVVFALKAARHTCVMPDAALAERIAEFCAARGISLAHTRFEIATSEAALPTLRTGPLDLVLIDGNHAFPAPFIDWYYTAPALRVGGYLVVDDTGLWTGAVLRDFLLAEPEWEMVAEEPGRAAVFAKRAEVDGTKGWGEQPYVVARSAGRGTRREKAHRGLDLLLDGDLRGFAVKAARNALRLARSRLRPAGR